MRTLRLFALYLLMGVLSIGFYACSSDDKEPKVEPAEKVFLEIEKAGYTINAEAQELEVQIHTNIKVNMSTEYSEGDNGWINIGKVDATGEYLTYHLDIKENTKSSQRIGNLIVTPSASQSIPIDAKISGNTIVITQAGAEH